MIKLIKKINATYFKTYNDLLFVLENDNSPLFIYDLNSFELIKKVGGNYGGGLYIVKKYIIDESFKGVDINTLLEKKFFEEENVYYYIKNNKYAVIRKFIEEFEVEFYLLEIEKFKILQKIKFEGEIALLTELGVVISYTNDTLYKYSDFSLLWQKDLNDYFLKDTETEVEVKEVYLYENSLIVVTKAGVVRLNIETGELIWKTNYYACTMEIVGQFGYVCTGLSLYRINLEDGETYNYGREYAQLPDFEYEGKTYWAAGNRVVYHEGLLWYLAYDSGDSFVIAINLENAEYQWIHKIDTYEKVDKIQFYQDKMFVSDSGGNLFIYEEMK